MNKLKRNIIAMALVVFFVGVMPAVGMAEHDYDGMVKRIETFFSTALTHYKAGNKEQAKLDAEAAYFQVFENMEGPIRVNISAKKNYILEAEFSGIRKMVIKGDPYDEIELRISYLVTDLKKVAAELKGGFVIKAEPAAGEAVAVSPGKIDSTWLLDLDLIRMRLKSCADACKVDNRSKAQEFILQALFDGYKNTLLEQAVEKHVSAERSLELTDGFMKVIGLVRNGESIAAIQKQSAALLGEIEKNLKGLPLVRGAVGKAAPRLVTKDTIPDNDWPGIGREMMKALESAMQTFKNGDSAGASQQVQSIYFDIFEGTKLEVSIGVLDDQLMLGMESIFGDIVRGMSAGEPADSLWDSIDDLRSDLDLALQLLEKVKK